MQGAWLCCRHGQHTVERPHPIHIYIYSTCDIIGPVLYKATTLLETRRLLHRHHHTTVHNVLKLYLARYSFWTLYLASQQCHSRLPKIIMGKWTDEQMNPELLSSFLIGIHFCIFHRLEFKIDIITFRVFFRQQPFLHEICLHRIWCSTWRHAGYSHLSK